MSEDTNSSIEQLIQSLRQRWGDHILMPLGDLPAQNTSPFMSGISALDALLQPHGIPRGQMSMIYGSPSSGAATLCLKILANIATTPLVYFDASTTLDPEYLHICGINPSDTLVVHPDNLVQALNILRDLLHHLHEGVLFIDAGMLGHIDTRVIQSFQGLMVPLKRTNCIALLLVDEAINTPLQPYASLALHVQRREWVQTEDDVNGYRSDIEIVKNKGGQTGQIITLTLVCDGDAS